MSLSHTGVLASSTTPSTPSTTNPAAVVITVDGNHYPYSQIPGAHNDPADLYGIVLVFLAIAVALLAARWIFGRGARRPG